ncbi:hypothetical protein B0O99DRAFT_691622 [Bisporella sp. PMI_857]|nr:hypothetical protein B0O99DRAFT_691622 [Bisporella sp. PMI_857]
MTDPMQNTTSARSLPILGSITSWYQPSFGPQCPRDIAHEAYLDAIHYLQKELRYKDTIKQLVEGKTTIQDIQSIVEKAKHKYESSEETNARRWLRTFSTRVMYYGPVFDMLSQHHPEYVALAWGSVKFVLMGIINHANLVSQFSQALAEIGEALWQTKLSAELYGMEQMKEAISRLYAHIILFFQQAVKWYSMSSAGRAISSIFKPFELDYKDTVEEIKLCSQTVNNIASAASRAELRDLHDIIKEQYTQDKERDKKLQQMQTELKSLQEKMFWNIVQTLRPEHTPEETFTKAQLITKRTNATTRPSKDWKVLLDCLGRWVSADGSALFIVKVALCAEAKAKEFAVDVIQILRPLPYGVIWNLSICRTRSKPASLVDMIKSLIFQALTNDPNILKKYPAELDATAFLSTHTEDEWISLLSKLLSRLSKHFIVVEAQDIFQINRETPEWPARFFHLFQNLIDQAKSSGNILKILILGYGTRQLSLQDFANGSNRIVSSIQRPVPVPARFRGRFASRRKDLARRQHLKVRF